jgi:signal transduction histidine kinase
MKKISFYKTSFAPAAAPPSDHGNSPVLIAGHAASIRADIILPSGTQGKNVCLYGRPQGGARTDDGREGRVRWCEHVFTSNGRQLYKSAFPSRQIWCGLFSAFLFLVASNSALLAQSPPEIDSVVYKDVYRYWDPPAPDSFGLRVIYHIYNHSDSLTIVKLCELAVERKEEAKKGSWLIWGNLGYVNYYMLHSDYGAALSYLDEATASIADGNLRDRVYVNYYAARVNIQLGEAEKVIAYSTAAIDAIKASKHPERYAIESRKLYYMRSAQYNFNKDYLKALADCLKALDYQKSIFPQIRMTKGSKAYGRLYQHLATIQAEFSPENVWGESLKKSAAYYLATKTSFDSVKAIKSLLRVVTTVEDAEDYFKTGKRVASRLKFQYQHIELLNLLSDFYAKKGITIKQEAVVEEILALPPEDQIRDIMLNASIDLGNFQLERGQTIKVIAQAKQVLAEARQVSLPKIEYRALLQLNEAYRQAGNFKAAYTALTSAGAIEERTKASTDKGSLMASFLNYQYEQEAKIKALEEQQVQQSLTARLNQQRTLLLVAAATFLLLFALLFQFNRNLRRKQRSARALEQKQVLLERSNTMLQEFSDTVAHDLLSNLNLILSSGNTLIGPTSGKEELSGYFHYSQKIIERLRVYCLDLLTAASISPTDTMTTAAAAKLILEETIEHYRLALAQNNFEIETELLPETPLPPTLLKQFLHNGITNAIKYAPQKGVRPYLKIAGGIDKKGGSFWFIQDNGLSKGAKNKPVSNSGAQAFSDKKGLGIGLQKLKKQLELFGASLQLSDFPEKGFRLTLAMKKV